MQKQPGQHMEAALTALISQQRSPADVYKALSEQRVDLVFTAHPTQAMRESVRSKYMAMHREIEKLHATALSASERAELLENMYSSIQAAWCALCRRAS